MLKFVEGLPEGGIWNVLTSCISLGFPSTRRTLVAAFCRVPHDWFPFLDAALESIKSKCKHLAVSALTTNLVCL
jgi:hypothetical protein